MKQLNASALQLCKDNYRTNCGGCSLRPQCCRPVGPGQEALYRWVTEVNEAADSICIPKADTVPEGQLTLF